MHMYDEFLQEKVLNHLPINYLFIYNFEILKIWWMFAKQKEALLVEITLEK
jgi:hypothetical protein